MPRWAWGAVIFCGLLLTACGEDDQRTDTVTPDDVRRAREALDPRLVVRLDSGNAAMRARDPAAALEQYREATTIDPESAAAWFGVYMAAGALGEEDEAVAALERARDLEPRASLLDPDTLDGDPRPR
jgi:Tfp pilus assembly protein PilF